MKQFKVLAPTEVEVEPLVFFIYGTKVDEHTIDVLSSSTNEVCNLLDSFRPDYRISYCSTGRTIEIQDDCNLEQVNDNFVKVTIKQFECHWGCTEMNEEALHML